jgi:hypothetical protein
MPMGFPRYSQRKLPGVTSAGQVESAHADDVIINTDKDKIPAVDRVDFVFMFLLLLTVSGSCPPASHSLLLARGEVEHRGVPRANGQPPGRGLAPKCLPRR